MEILEQLQDINDIWNIEFLEKRKIELNKEVDELMIRGSEIVDKWLRKLRNIKNIENELERLYNLKNKI